MNKNKRKFLVELLRASIENGKKADLGCLLSGDNKFSECFETIYPSGPYTKRSRKYLSCKICEMIEEIEDNEKKNKT